MLDLYHSTCSIVYIWGISFELFSNIICKLLLVVCEVICVTFYFKKKCYLSLGPFNAALEQYWRRLILQEVNFINEEMPIHFIITSVYWRLPVKTLQLEQLAVVGRAEEPSVVASRMRLVFSTLEVSWFSFGWYLSTEENIWWDPWRKAASHLDCRICMFFFDK